MAETEKEFEQEDPFEMVRMFLDAPADENFYNQMARTFVEEYMMMGWADDEILALFHEPYYRGTHDILQKKGEGFVKELIHEVRHDRCRVPTEGGWQRKWLKPGGENHG